MESEDVPMRWHLLFAPKPRRNGLRDSTERAAAEAAIKKGSGRNTAA